MHDTAHNVSPLILFNFFPELNSHTATTAVSLSNQYDNMNSNNSVPSLHGNVSLPATTTSVSFVTDDNKTRYSEKVYTVEVNSRGKTWFIKRNVENFRLLDQQCHRCVYDRKYSQLSEVPMEENVEPSISSNQYYGTNSKVGNRISDTYTNTLISLFHLTH